MTNNIVKAVVAKVQIGHIEIDGLMMPDGSFGIAVPQIAELFGTNRNTTSRDLKRLLGEDFRPSKISTEIGNQSVNVISLTDFEQVMIKLDRAGNVKAQDFRDDLAGLALHQLFCNAFGIKLKELDLQNWLKERQEGKFYRRSLTDAIKHLIDNGNDINYGLITLRTYKACGLEASYKDYKDNHKDHNYRNTLTDLELRKIAKFEELTADFVLVDQFDIETAMQNASRYIR
jgi:hypothetical protein